MMTTRTELVPVSTPSEGAEEDVGEEVEEIGTEIEVAEAATEVVLMLAGREESIMTRTMK